MDFGNPPMGLTEKNSATYLSSGNPCLDFFFHVVPDSPSSQLTLRLDSAWSHNPLTALKLICNLRGVRGTGKSDKEGFYTAALWLHKNHPKTLASNVHVFASFGYLKDLLEILFRILQGPEARSAIKKQWESTKSSRGRGVKRAFHLTTTGEKRSQRAEVSRDERIRANYLQVLEVKQRARDLRREKQLERSNKAIVMYNTDLDYQFLFEQISTLFADLLKADIQSLDSGELKNISLAGKWCPTIDSSYDKYTLICASIAKKLFPRESYPEYDGIGDDQYLSRVRDRLRKEVLVLLHEALKLPEVYMSAKEWGSVLYNRVASVAMKNYTKIFMERDKERFSQYLENVKQGKAKIAAGALLPHDIIEPCDDTYSYSDEERTVAELQWKRMVDDMLQKGKLTNCIAIADVSESMEGIPMEVAIALGILVSELSEEPWKGQVISFSEDPQLHLIEGTNLVEKSEIMKEMGWGGTTNFQLAFDQILKVAEIVFWNLRDSSATPVTATQNGVALLSGFSNNLLTLFLEGGGEINPQLVMEAAISGDDYQKLVLYD